MNKKLLMTLLVGVLALTVVSAGVMLYYGQITATVKVTQPITVTGDLEYTIEDAMAGETVDAPGYVKISNAAPDERAVMISEYYVPDGIDVIYDVCIVIPISGGISACVYHPLGYNKRISIPSGGYALLDISYELDSMLETGDYTIKTRIEEPYFIVVPA